MENPFDFSKEKAANTVKRIWLVNKDLVEESYDKKQSDIRDA